MIHSLVHEHRETFAAAVVLLAAVVLPLLACAVEKPAESSAPPPVKLFTVPEYTEGVVFDRDGVGYISSRKFVYRFTLDGKREVWAETGAANGHKILPDGSHLLCD